MGYLAITSQEPDLVVEKTSETIFIEGKRTFTFFEIEFVFNGQSEVDSRSFQVSIIIPGKVLRTQEARAILDDPSFLPWYYSQKAVRSEGAGMRLSMNDRHTTIVPCQVCAHYDRRNAISQIDVAIDYQRIEGRSTYSLHTFFCVEAVGHVNRQRGNLFAESRYFDRKLCPKGDFFVNTILRNNVAPVRCIYCWFVMPKGYIANDYTTYGSFAPRDARIIEKEYNVLLNSRPFVKRLFNRLWDAVYGRPQVINWVIKEGAISFNKNYKSFGKWDDIRLFVSSSGFPLGSFFLYAAGFASIVGVMISLFVK
jgi:hypothetical protein